MKKLLYLIILCVAMGPLPGLLSACSEEEDCSMTARPMLQCNIYRAEYTGTLLRDTLDSLTVTAYATDSVIINKPAGRERHQHPSALYDRFYRAGVPLRPTLQRHCGHPPREYPLFHFSRLRLPNATNGYGHTLHPAQARLYLHNQPRCQYLWDGKSQTILLVWCLRS